MKNLRTSKKAKVAAFILCVLCLTLALGCRGPLTWLNTMGAGDGYDCYKDSVEDLLLENYVQPAAVTLQSISEAEGADPGSLGQKDFEAWCADFGPVDLMTACTEIYNFYRYQAAPSSEAKKKSEAPTGK